MSRSTHVIPEGGHLPEADSPGAADEVGRVVRVGDATVSVYRHRGRRRRCNEMKGRLPFRLFLYCTFRCPSFR